MREGAESNSSGSVGVTPEVLQAEVSRQLDAAMGEMVGKLNDERRRAEEATAEAQRLRLELQTFESRMAADKPSVVAPPGLEPQVVTSAASGRMVTGADEQFAMGHGVSSRIPANHPLPGPMSATVLQDQARWSDGVCHDNQGPVSLEASLPLGEGANRAEGVDPEVFGPGVSSRIPENHPLPGHGRNIFTGRSSGRSQSPSGPRAFFSGLFGLGREGHLSEPTRPTTSTAVSHAMPPPQPPPLPHRPTAQAAGLQSDQLLTTLAQEIEALLRQQQSSRGDRPETVKPGITELPLLPDYQPSKGSIDLLHWLTHIAPIMEDLSDTSLAWWQETVKDATMWYSQYVSASPLARLQLQPRPSTDLRPEWARVERRATAMMLTAIPKPIREEIIANGQVSPLMVLCKLYAVYQPGNLQEKTLVLRMLEQPEECLTALQAVEGLRKWSLWRKRAATLGMAEPDALSEAWTGSQARLLKGVESWRSGSA